MKNFPSLKALDETSAILLSAPGIDSGVIVDNLQAWILMPSIRRSLPAVGEVDVLNLYAQETALALSQKVAMCLFLS